VYGGRVLVSAATIAGADDGIEAREIDRVVLVGQSQPQAIFEIMGRKGELTPVQIELRTHYSEGLAACRSRDWEEARRAFAAALECVPNCEPAIQVAKDNTGASGTTETRPNPFRFHPTYERRGIAYQKLSNPKARWKRK
jgi:hypothetical protein